MSIPPIHRTRAHRRALQPQGKASGAGFKTLMKASADIIFMGGAIAPA
jgi:hypothetical protein